ncbi:MAG: J domain-containing protein [Lachnospiraceae bacterium]|nr:J domain-containing protein [Lachnospiraceae bacterium]
MIDWEEILRTESIDELKKVKRWLFQENMRIENERKDLEQAQDKFLKERVKFRDEMDTLNRRTVLERKRLKEENLFFDKKMAILQAGFQQLEEDRKTFERQKQNYVHEEKVRRECVIESGDIVEVLFRSVNNPLALRKRYRDLVKIYHPDNLFGDEELAQMINKEFLRRKKEEW